MSGSSDSKPELKQSRIPKSRFARLSRMGALATSVAGGMVAEGARQLASGKRPKLSELLLTPSNAKRVASQLSKLRGAAMKLGQLLSMDAGDFLPPELAEILSRLRSQASSMPDRQLRQVLEAEWGIDWQSRLSHFDFKPAAAASIGQVHQAVNKDGQRLAIKIQYPGVAESIDSDIDNVAGLLRMSGLVPEGFDMAPLLSEAKKQLHEEADYRREAAYLKAYSAALGQREGCLVPQVDDSLTTDRILAMSFVTGLPVEEQLNQPQEVRNRLASRMFSLLFHELFNMQLMQTDPNFANYLYQPAEDCLVLLDFGATRPIDRQLSAQYLRLLEIVGHASDEELADLAQTIGYFDERIEDKHRRAIVKLMRLACEPWCHGVYRFGQTDLATRIRDAGIELGRDRDFWHAPPVDCLFIHRKVGGVFLLASRLKAEVDVRSLALEAIQAGGWRFSSGGIE